MKKMFYEAMLDLIQDKVKQIGNNQNNLMFEVDYYVVRMFVKKGRTFLTCTCPNGTRFCLDNPICHHKISTLLYYWRSMHDK